MSDVLLVNANALAIPLVDRSVQMCATSPPYYGLRDYGTAKWEGGDAKCNHSISAWNDNLKPNVNRPERDGEKRKYCLKCGAIRIDEQLGLEPTPEAYVANLVAVFREVKRVLRDDGVVFLNLGDSYATQSAGNKTPSGFQQKSQAGQAGALVQMDGKLGRREYGLKPKDLIGIPWRVAFALQADGAYTKELYVIEQAISAIYDAYSDGTVPDKAIQALERLRVEYSGAKGNSWWLRSDIIWAKPNPMPESVRDRPTKSHEYIFLLTKSARYYWDQEAVKEKTDQTWSIDSYIRKQRVMASGGALSGGTGDGTGEHNTRNIRTVWNVSTSPYRGAHFATWPPGLVEPMIKAGSRTGDIVLDPFTGSGTTLMVARQLGRHAIGLDLSYPYLHDQARRRLELDKLAAWCA